MGIFNTDVDFLCDFQPAGKHGGCIFAPLQWLAFLSDGLQGESQSGWNTWWWGEQRLLWTAHVLVRNPWTCQASHAGLPLRVLHVNNNEVLSRSKIQQNYRLVDIKAVARQTEPGDSANLQIAFLFISVVIWIYVREPAVVCVLNN